MDKDLTSDLFSDEAIKELTKTPTIGICKECPCRIELIAINQVQIHGMYYEIFTCPECSHPNSMSDFTGFDKYI